MVTLDWPMVCKEIKYMMPSEEYLLTSHYFSAKLEEQDGQQEEIIESDEE
jgi:hypothetical protein